MQIIAIYLYTLKQFINYCVSKSLFDSKSGRWERFTANHQPGKSHYKKHILLKRDRHLTSGRTLLIWKS